MKEQKQLAGKIERQSNTLFYLAVLLLTLSVLIFGYNLIKIAKITGQATGTLNLTVESKTNINFTTNVVNWGTGQVSPGFSFATLNTAAGANNVTGGNWTGNTWGLVIENLGNQNVTLDLAATKTAATFVGGTNAGYMWNVTNVETNSCLPNITLGAWWNVNATARVCSVFYFAVNNDTIRIDFNVTIPDSAAPQVASDTITATATAVG